MGTASSGDRQRVVVVTGGGGGIGAAIAEELGRTGHFVVTMDPLVTVDGSEQLPPAEETTAGRIVAAGGSARASSVSVTDREAVRDLFEGLVAELGGLDGVVNVAGITRPTSFATGDEDDWLGVLSVHLDGYLNILGAALPIMARAGYGRILGVTSGSGWRPADTGAYGCAKRAVASLTWQLGAQPPAGVVVNAMSPIAATRMVTAALGRAKPAATSGASSSTGGLSLDAMPTPDQLGPLGAHLVGDGFSWCSGQVLFAGGPEAAVIDPPRLLEVVRSEGASLAHVLDVVTTGALIPAEEKQATNGATNPRFGPVFDAAAPDERAPAGVRSCALVSDRPELVAALAAALEARGVAACTVPIERAAPGFAGATEALRSTVERAGPVDAVVVALAAPAPVGDADGWERVLAEHEGVTRQIHVDASWTRAVVALSAGADRPLRLVTLTDATTAGGRSRAQASAQLTRSSRRATHERVAAFAVSVESADAGDEVTVAELAAHLVCDADALALSGAELVAGSGWFGLRSHPRPGGSITVGDGGIPRWFDDTLRRVVNPVAPTGADTTSEVTG